MVGKEEPTKPTLPSGRAIGGAAAVAAAAAYAWHYLGRVAHAPKLLVGEGLLKSNVLPRLDTLRRPYRPTPWAVNTHLQTAFGLLRTLTLHVTYRRQLILSNDGATLGLDWFDNCDRPDAAPPDAPVLLVCHGINGGSHEGYCKWVCAAAAARGWRAVVLNYRGCNGLPFTAPRGYAATLTHDIFTAVYSVKARFPHARLCAVGYSLGGLKLTKYVAEADAGLHIPGRGQRRLFEGSGLSCAAVVSSPVCLWSSADNLNRPYTLNYMYNLAVAHKLKEHIQHHREDIEAVTRFDVAHVLSAWTLQEIEDRGLPVSFGFANRQEYYEAASSLSYIPHIHTPTLFLLAEDDPFLGVIPDLECQVNPNTLLALTKHGGHVAFLQGMWPLGASYMDDAVLDFFQKTLDSLHGQGAVAAVGVVEPLAPGAAAGPGPEAGSAPRAAQAGEAPAPAAECGATRGCSEGGGGGSGSAAGTQYQERARQLLLQLQREATQRQQQQLELLLQQEGVQGGGLGGHPKIMSKL